MPLLLHQDRLSLIPLCRGLINVRASAWQAHHLRQLLIVEREMLYPTLTTHFVIGRMF